MGEGSRSYLSNGFNVLDVVRFIAIGLAVATRVLLLLDESRDIDMNTGAYVNTESVATLYQRYDMITSIITLLTLLSTVQYFELQPRMRVIKGTLMRFLQDIPPFGFIFLLFFCFYALVGVYLLGPTIENFSTYDRAIFSCFDMMNANYPFSDLFVAIPPRDPLKYFIVVLYYFTFILLHFFMLLNCIIAIVVEAYLDIQQDEAKLTSNLLRANMDSMRNDFLQVPKQALRRLYLHLVYYLRPHHFEQLRHYGGALGIFVLWTDAEWQRIIAKVVKNRYNKGLQFNMMSLSELAREIMEFEDEFILFALEKALVEKALVHKVGASKQSTRQSIDIELNAGFGETPLTSHLTIKQQVYKFSQVLAQDICELLFQMECPVPGLLASVASRATSDPLWSQVLTEDNYVFRQCSERFFHRAYFKGPPNMLEPLNEAAQPPAKTWLDLTLSKMMTKLDRSDEKLSKLNEKLLGPDGNLRGDAFTSALSGGVGTEAATHMRAQMLPAVDPSGMASLRQFIPASSRTSRSPLPHPAPSVAASDATRSAARWLSEQEAAETSGKTTGALFAQAYPAFSTAALATALAKAENANAENTISGATMRARTAAQSSRAASNDLWHWG
jgi:hypothetical protein